MQQKLLWLFLFTYLTEADAPAAISTTPQGYASGQSLKS